MSGASSLIRTPWVSGLLAGLWVSLFLVIDGHAEHIVAWSAVPLCTAGVALLTRFPAVGTCCVIAAAGVCAFTGIPYGEIEMVLPTVYVLAWQGRHLASLLAGWASVLAFTVVFAVRAEAPWYAGVVTLALTSTAWAFGRVVRRRAEVAVATARKAADLAEIDLEEVMVQSKLASRQHAANASLTVLRDAVSHMCALTAEIARSEPPYRAHDIDEVRAEGSRAVEALHRVLALLDDRASSPHASRASHGSGGAALATDSAPIHSPRAHHVWRSRRAYVWGTLSLLASLGLVVVFAGANWALLLATAVLSICVWLAPQFPLASGVSAALAFGISWWGMPFPPDALLPVSVSFAALLWRLTEIRHPTATAAILLAVAGALTLGTQFHGRGVGFVLVLTALVIGAAFAWREREEIILTELSRVAQLTAAIAHAQRSTERNARIELARELHDGVSHGVTAMTLQVQASHALGTSDPTEARRSLAIALEVGNRTLHELEVLATGTLCQEIHDLSFIIAGARAVGLRIEDHSSGSPDSLSYRIVQEALTNITRYAPGAQVTVETADHGDVRSVRIVDDGGAQAPPTHHPWKALGRGTGLRGLAERVAERGGTFAAQHRTTVSGLTAGFEVAAAWPVGLPAARREQPE